MAILLIEAGGTIGMAATAAGFAPKSGIVAAALADMGRSDVDVVTLSPLIDSANATPADWNRIIAEISKNHDKYQGFVVTHGTDTLAYSAAAICLGLVGLNRAVVVTGAMVPLTMPDSDGLGNLADALATAQTAQPGVWVQFAGRLMHGARCRKSHSSALDAFAAAPGTAAPVVPAPALQPVAFGTPKLAVISMAPGMAIEVTEAALNHCDGVVLRVFGSGTVPESDRLRAALMAAQDRGVMVIAVTQCPEGEINIGTYAAGAILVDAGVVDGRDITVEAAYVKLAHVLAWSDDTAARRARLAQVLCGECADAQMMHG